MTDALQKSLQKAVLQGPAPTQALTPPPPSPLSLEVAAQRAAELVQRQPAGDAPADGAIRLLIDYQSDYAAGDLITVVCGPITISVRPYQYGKEVLVPVEVRDLAYRLGVFLLQRGAARSFILTSHGQLFLLLLAQHAQLHQLASLAELERIPLPMPQLREAPCLKP